jgi:hypothetical protein
MMRKHATTVPDTQLALVEAALQEVEDARAALVEARRTGADRAGRRQAHADLRAAYDVADARLREVADALKQAGHRRYVEWFRWRERLSRLDTERQVHLFDEREDPGIRSSGSVRAIDTGMSGPAIGELQHGESRPPGTEARYGLDMEAVLFGMPDVPSEPRPVADVVPLPVVTPPSPSAA